MLLPGSTTFSTIEEVVGRSTQQEAGRSSQPVVASEIALQAGRRSAFSSGGATNRKSSSGGATSRKSSAGYHSTTTATGNHITTWRRPPNLCEHCNALTSNPGCARCGITICSECVLEGVDCVCMYNTPEGVDRVHMYNTPAARTRLTSSCNSSASSGLSTAPGWLDAGTIRSQCGLQSDVPGDTEATPQDLCDWWSRDSWYDILPKRIYLFLGSQVSDSVGEEEWDRLLVEVCRCMAKRYANPLAASSDETAAGVKSSDVRMLRVRYAWSHCDLLDAPLQLSEEWLQMEAWSSILFLIYDARKDLQQYRVTPIDLPHGPLLKDALQKIPCDSNDGTYECRVVLTQRARGERGGPCSVCGVTPGWTRIGGEIKHGYQCESCWQLSI